MIREVDLVSYLPDFMLSYKETAAALEAEDPEFLLVWNAVDRVLYNHFISTADEYGISRYEKLLGVCPEITDTLETRRMRVQNRWLNRLPYTVRTLAVKMAEVLGGEHNFSIWSDFKNTYEMILTVYSTDDGRTEEIKYILSVMVPVNIVTDIIYESAHKGSIYYGGVMSEADIIQIEQR